MKERITTSHDNYLKYFDSLVLVSFIPFTLPRFFPFLTNPDIARFEGKKGIHIFLAVIVAQDLQYS